MSLDPLSRRVGAEPAHRPHVEALDVRPLQPDDTDILHDLVATIEAADGLATRTSPGRLRDLIAQPWNDLAADSVLVLDAGRPVGWALVDRLPGADVRSVRVVLHGGVSPAARGRGVGTAVLDWQVARARERLAQSDSVAVGRIIADVDEAEPPGSAALLRRAGFSPARYFTVLRRDLSQPIPDVGPRGAVRIVPYADALDEATRLAHNAAFEDHWGSEEATAEAWAQGRDGFAPEWSFLAVVGEGADLRVVGYELASRSEHEWPVVGYRFGYTELLGVVRECRGHRIAVALLAHAMRAFRDAGMQYAALDVDTESPSGADELYARLGYEAQHTETVFTIEV